MTPVLSFKELHRLIELLRPHILGARVDRVFVPIAPGHPDGFLKKEWVIALYGNGRSHQLYLSLRSQHCGIVWMENHLLKPSSRASRSGFDLSMGKSIVGSKVTRLEMIPNDRVVILEFTGATTIEIHLHLVPARPYAVILEAGILLAATDTRTEYTPPSPRTLSAEQLAKIPDRVDWVSTLDSYSKRWWKARDEELKQIQLARLKHLITDSLTSLVQKIKSLNEQEEQTQKEPDWAYFGTLLKIHLHEKPKPKNHHYELLDYEKDELIQVPADPKLNLEANLNRLFQLAKRKEKRLEESRVRAQALSEKQRRLATQLDALLHDPSEDVLERLQEEWGGDQAPTTKDQKKIADFSGKQYRSKEGLTILVGRNRAENLDLTFKIARGNDLWLHVKGKPGSHAVILLPPKKTASLDTLLDAAHLCILLSGGKDWGKTEVDYTHRKYVKKIKGSQEVSYSQQKTLTISLDSERVKRLYSQD